MKWLLPILALALLAAETHARRRSDWAAGSQNPMADLMKLHVANRLDQGVGHKDNAQYTLSLRPSMASDVACGWTMVSRLDVPFTYRPGLAPGEPGDHGIGDIRHESLYGPAGWRRFYWGIGPQLDIPSASDSGLSTRKWSAGIGGTGVYAKGNWTLGLRANHLWSFAGSGTRNVNRSTVGYFAYRNFADGWWIGTNPENTADWERAGGNVWSVPVGGGFGKVLSEGKHAVNLKLDGYYYAEQPPTGAEWFVNVGIEWLFDNDSFFTQRRL
jgi:hypothetical protein